MKTMTSTLAPVALILKRSGTLANVIVAGIAALTLLNCPAAYGATLQSKAANAAVYFGLPFSSLSFDNPLTGSEMVLSHKVLDWRDADYLAGPPRTYGDWSVNDPANIDGSAEEIYLRQQGHSAWTTTTVPSTIVSIHLNSDQNDGLAAVLVDGVQVATFDMNTVPCCQTVLIVVNGLGNTTHTITVNDQGWGVGGTDVHIVGAAALQESEKKWDQPPAGATNVFYGWNQQSIESMPPWAADDWVCTNATPVTKIRWWGSFQNWTETNVPVLLAGFQIKFWTDVPKNEPTNTWGFSHPGDVIPPPITCTNFTPTFYGWDYDPRSNQLEACFQFEQTLTPDQYFYQQTNATGSNIYWISITAMQPPTDYYLWGWKTRPRDPTSPAPDDAVMFDPTQIPPWYQPIYWPHWTNSWDMAFELLSQPTGVGSSKWQQLPDLSNNGMDVNATSNSPPPTPYLLADDFLCTNAGPITNITIWGSWFNDATNPIPTFVLSIHTNIPPYSPPWNTNPYSMPGAVLWTNIFPSNTYTYSILQTNVAEWWLNSSNPPGNGVFPGDYACWQYDFNVAPANAFYQQGTAAKPTTYWLDVQSWMAGTKTLLTRKFGWKTSTNHWQDSACWITNSESYNGWWNALSYPQNHPYYGQPIDLAFRLNASSQTQGEITKWSQRPVPYANAFNGWNQYSVDSQYVADDWACTTTNPVTDIHWWGSFIGWGYTNPPQMPDAFMIQIWTDVTNGTDAPFSHPGNPVWGNYCTNFTCNFVGWDVDPRNPQAMPDACFKFEQDLTTNEWFQQPLTGSAGGTNIYWISIAAHYNSGPPSSYAWGWKTRPHTNSLAPDDAVTNSYYAPGWGPIWYPDPTNSWDMAFELTTTKPPTNPPPPCCPVIGGVKYEQDPDLVNGVDWTAGWGWVLADDFPCTNTGPITDIHLWGSWAGDWFNPDAAFVLGIWSDVPTNASNPFSHPGTNLWHQVYTNGQYTICPPTIAPEYIFSSLMNYTNRSTNLYYLCFYVDPTNQFIQRGSPTQKTNYWLSLTTQLTNGLFGWKSSTNAYGDDAVGMWGQLWPTNWYPICDSNYQSLKVNLAFRITGSTNPCPEPWLECSPLTVSCTDHSWQPPAPLLHDPCCTNNGTLSLTGSNIVSYCPTVYQFNWAYTNCYGQTAYTNCQVTVTSAPPVLVPTNYNITCGSPIPTNPPGVIAPCCTNTIVPIWQYSVTNSGVCTTIITQYWKAVDCNCTNLFSTGTQTITVTDTNAPLFVSTNCGTAMNVLWGNPWSFTVPTAQYVCSGSNAPVGILLSNVIYLSYCSSSNIIVWSATNVCSGAYSTCTQVVTVVCVACNESNGVKYVQWPNLLYGQDVWNNGVSNNAWMLADDFVCTNTGPISDIHLWGSWLGDQVGTNTLTFWLGIYDDVPVSVSNQFSHPGTLLWQQWFAPGKYGQTYFSPGQEYFVDPGTTNFMGPDSQVWYYCFYPANPLKQKGSPAAPKTYWLAAYAQPPSNNVFQYGWKTTTNLQHDISVRAVWPGNPTTNNPVWTPTFTPEGPVDLAFKITTDTNYTNILKYTQWPNTTNGGYDVWNSSTLPPGVADGPWVVADDFVCTNTGYITDIHLWGSWYYDQVATNQITFWIGLFNDVPAVTNAGGQIISNSHPGSLFWSQCFPPGTYSESYWSYAYEAFLDPGPPSRIGSDNQAWYYSFFLTNCPMPCFFMTNCPVQWGSAYSPRTYWLAAFAQLPAGLPNYFGWKTTTNVQHDISVHSPWTLGPCPTNIPPSAFVWTPTHADTGPALDLAFQISTITNCSETFLTIDRTSPTQVTVTWPAGTLQWATNVAGPYVNAPVVTPGVFIDTDLPIPAYPTNRFYRVLCDP